MTTNRGVISSSNLSYIEDLYQAWKADAGAVGAEWDELFREQERAPQNGAPSNGTPSGGTHLVPSDLVYKQSRVDSLIWAYRDVGYLYARLNPLSVAGDRKNFYTEPEHTYEQLTLSEFGLSEADLDTEFSAGSGLKPGRMKLRDIIKALEETYCSTIAVEFLHIQNKPIRRWLIQQMEGNRNRPRLQPEEKRALLDDLVRTEEFERFLHTAFIGQKRFSLEGAEVIIPALHHAVDSAHDLGIQEIVMGMAHRGRLTVLHRILGMPLEDIFHSFEGFHDPGVYGGTGDVKYHLGFVLDHVQSDGSAVRINLLANPSHLESVDAVVEGMARAVQRNRGDRDRQKVAPVILHGDAAFSGQGVVEETFNLSTLRGYRTGGTIHVIINNQIGFTTAVRDARSSYFPTDVAKMLPVPIFHVNGDDPEAVISTMDLALRYRHAFGRDVVVDVFCYRKHGHNEGDDPSFTHPLMYRIIEKKTSQAALYAAQCRAEGIFSAGEEESLRKECRAALRAALQAARSAAETQAAGAPSAAGGDAVPQGAGAHPAPGNEGAAAARAESHDPAGTADNSYRWDETVRPPAEEQLRMAAGRLSVQPPGFNIHPKLKRIVEEKAARLARDGTLDWAFAESLSFASLLLEKVPVRLSGQDSARGTFSQRHLVWWDTEASLPKPYTPLANLAADQARFSVYDSPLTEYAILGFEYGYSLGRPGSLVIWEAQFGDFSNGAQVIIDNFIAAGEAKWGSRSGLVLLLPHGFEGQGPEHSSAHLERFLMLCARDNIQVVNCTTPAQYFHLLRRQVKRSFRKPLIVMTPKSLLRHPQAVSTIGELAGGGFSELLDDPKRPKKPGRLLLCSGKIYYDLAAHRDGQKDPQAAIVRLEQLYPFPREGLKALLARYRGVPEVIWVQEEPRNRGAWAFVHDRFLRSFPGVEVAYVGREESASPAAGSHSLHVEEQERVVRTALLDGTEQGTAAEEARPPKSHSAA